MTWVRSGQVSQWHYPKGTDHVRVVCEDCWEAFGSAVELEHHCRAVHHRHATKLERTPR